MPTLSYNISFALDQDLGTGSIKFTDTTHWVTPADIEVAWGFTAPDGTPCFLPTQGASWSIHPDISDNKSLPLPTDVYNKVITGVYKIYTLVIDSGQQTEDPGGPDNVTLCTDLPAFCLEPDVNCLTMEVAFEDKSKWTEAGWTVSNRLMTLQWPSISYHANITGTDVRLSTGGEPTWNGTWTGTASLTATKGNTSIDITIVKQFTVNCGLDGCRLNCLMKSVYAEYEELRGRDIAGAARVLSRLSELSAIATLIDGSIACGDPTFVDSLIKRFKEVATGKPGGDCGCSDCDEPKPLVPLSGGGGGTTYTEGAGITIVGSVVSVSQALRTLIDALFNTDVDSPGGSIVVTETTTPGTPDLLTKHLAVKVPAPHTIAWTESWTTNGANRVVGTYYKNPATGNLFQEPTIRQAVPAPFNNKWQYAGFFSGGGFPFAYTVDVKIYDIVPAAGQGVNLTVGSVIRAVEERNVSDFILSLVQTTLAGTTGAVRKLDDPTWIALIDSFTVQIVLTQVL